MAGARETYDTLPYFFSDILELSFEAWGNLNRPDRVIARGSLEDGTVTYWYVRADRIAGALAIGLPDAEREPTQALISGRAELQNIEGALADASTDLVTLL